MRQRGNKLQKIKQYEGNAKENNDQNHNHHGHRDRVRKCYRFFSQKNTFLATNTVNLMATKGRERVQETRATNEVHGHLGLVVQKVSRHVLRMAPSLGCLIGHSGPHHIPIVGHDCLHPLMFQQQPVSSTLPDSRVGPRSAAVSVQEALPQ